MYFSNPDKFLVNDSNWYSKTTKKQANTSPEMQGMKQMYKIIGVPISEIKNYYIPWFKTTVDSIDWWLSITPYQFS